jgi:hypothetical protein
MAVLQRKDDGRDTTGGCVLYGSPLGTGAQYEPQSKGVGAPINIIMKEKLIMADEYIT